MRLAVLLGAAALTTGLALTLPEPAEARSRRCRDCGDGYYRDDHRRHSYRYRSQRDRYRYDRGRPYYYSRRPVYGGYYYRAAPPLPPAVVVVPPRRCRPRAYVRFWYGY